MEYKRLYSRIVIRRTYEDYKKWKDSMEEVRMSFEDAKLIYGSKVIGNRKATGTAYYDSETGDYLCEAWYLTPEEKAKFIELGGTVIGEN